MSTDDHVATAVDATGDDEPLLAVEELTTVFHTDKETVRAVDGVSFTVEAGETVGLVGESGSGKTVTARSILGLVDSPGVIESGSIRFRGDELTDDGWDAHRGDMAIVFQDPMGSLNPVYTVGNQIKEALRLHQNLRGSDATDEAIELLEAVGIPDAARAGRSDFRTSAPAGYGTQSRKIKDVALWHGACGQPWQPQTAPCRRCHVAARRPWTFRAWNSARLAALERGRAGCRLAGGTAAARALRRARPASAGRRRGRRSG